MAVVCCWRSGRAMCARMRRRSGAWQTREALGARAGGLGKNGACGSEVRGWPKCLGGLRAAIGARPGVWARRTWLDGCGGALVALRQSKSRNPPNPRSGERGAFPLIAPASGKARDLLLGSVLKTITIHLSPPTHPASGICLPPPYTPKFHLSPVRISYFCTALAAPQPCAAIIRITRSSCA